MSDDFRSVCSFRCEWHLTLCGVDGLFALFCHLVQMFNQAAV